MSWLSNGNNGRAPSNGTRRARQDLQLRVPPPRAGRIEMDGGDSSDSSSPSSCMSSDGSPCSKSMMLIGACTRCMMYCMVAKKNFPICINCKLPYLVDVLHHASSSGSNKKGSPHKSRGDKRS